MLGGQQLKSFNKLRIMVTILGCAIGLASSNVLAAVLQVGAPAVVLTPGQTIEIPLHNAEPITGDLTANGPFRPGDVTITPSPGCHLSAHHCGLLVSIARTSKRYHAVPVVVSESGATNTPVFALSVIYPGESEFFHTKPADIDSTPIMLSSQIGQEAVFEMTNASEQALTQLMAKKLPAGIKSSFCSKVASGATCPLKLRVHGSPLPGNFVFAMKSDQGLLQYKILSIVSPMETTASRPSPEVINDKPAPVLRSGNKLFYGVAEPHPPLTLGKIKNSDFTPKTNGPSYQIVKLTNQGLTQPLSIAISGSGARSFRLDYQAADDGAHKNCALMSHIHAKESCLVIIKGEIGDPRKAPEKATLTIQGAEGNVARFSLITTTYVYVAGGFNALGNASVSSGNLLAQCTAGTCSNAL